jgi:hypothetical protein
MVTGGHIWFAPLPHHQQPPLPHLKIPIIITKAILLQPLVHIMMSVEFKAVAFAHQLLSRHEFLGCGIQALFQHPPVMFQDQIDLADLDQESCSVIASFHSCL